MERDSVDQVAAKMLAQPEGSRWYALFPLSRRRRPPTLLRDRLFDLRKKGFNRLYPGREACSNSRRPNRCWISISRSRYSSWWIAWRSRRTCASAWWTRSRSAIAKPAKCIFEGAGRAAARRFASTKSSPASSAAKTFAEPEPSLFSFNSPFGACKRCQGFGNTIDYDMDLVIPNRALSLQQGAVDPWTKPQYSGFVADFRKDASGKVRLNVPFCELREEEMALVHEHVRDFFKRGGEEEVQSPRARVPEPVSRLHAVSGLRRIAAAARGAVDSRRREEPWPRSSRMNIAEAQEFFLYAGACAGGNGDRRQDPGRNPAAPEVPERRGTGISDAGPAFGDAFGRRSAAHPARHLPGFAAGGRLLRARRAVHRSAQPRHGRLIGILEELRDLGNTIVVVEHDPDVMRSADHIVDLGPGAGENGGRIVFEGDYQEADRRRQRRRSRRKYLRGDLQDFATSAAGARRIPSASCDSWERRRTT